MASETTRYLVEWTPWKSVREAAEKQGWTEADSVADFVDVDEFAVIEEFQTFKAALRRARMVDHLDTWNCPRIERQHLVNDHDDLGNVYRSKSWETDAMWEVMPDEPAPVEDEPHVTLTTWPPRC